MDNEIQELSGLSLEEITKLQKQLHVQQRQAVWKMDRIKLVYHFKVGDHVTWQVGQKGSRGEGVIVSKAKSRCFIQQHDGSIVPINARFIVKKDVDKDVLPCAFAKHLKSCSECQALLKGR